jgi:type IV pilus assembly protein PilE
MNGCPAATSGKATVAARCRIGFMTSFTALRHEARGFTLIELLIAVVVVGILAAVAFPSFMDSIRKGRRSEAFAALTQVQQAQERWRGSRPSYAGNARLTAAPGSGEDAGLGLLATTPGGYYSIAISGESETGYTATATAVASTSQASDVNCKTMAVRVTGGNLEYAGCGGGDCAFASTNHCWAR